ncbi:MAG: hypothetical protein ACKVOY_22260 [Burkholderiaceae bacterium]|jgi:hypothetical protein
MNIFNTATTTAVSIASIGVSLGRDQMAICGMVADTVDLANWTATTTVVTYGGHQLKVYSGTSSYAQLLIDTQIVNASHIL